MLILGFGLMLGTGDAAPKEVVIGAAYPLTGPVASAGADSKAAIDLAVDIINNVYDLNLPLARTAGLPNLGGTKVKVIVRDHQGKPEIGRAEAERLITQEKVVALFGMYHSAVTSVASQVAERYGVPYLTGESSSPRLHRRGLKWFFRTGLHDEHFTKAMFEYLKELQARRGIKLRTVGVMYEDTLFGKDSGTIQKRLAKKYGYKVVADIPYRSKSTTLTAEIQKMKAANPDVFLPTSYTNDAILMVKTMQELDYNPSIVIAQDAGHSDPLFVRAVGKLAEGVATRSALGVDLIDKLPLLRKVNAMYKQRRGVDLHGGTARTFMGLIVLADAINRAGSTEPEAIRQALLATDIKPDQIIMPWRGIKFDPKTGQNELATSVIMQLQGGKYYTIWPFEVATRKPIYPIPTWSQRQ
jgi:branched-chain amino acid transport system substrate-binding protein